MKILQPYLKTRYSRVNHVDVFPGSKRAEIEYASDKGPTYERFPIVWEAVFDGAVAQFKTCSYVRMIYGGHGICIWHPENKKLECKRGR